MNLNKKFSLDSVNERVIHCSICPRLANYITYVGKTRAKRFKDQDYWAKPLPSFGDVNAKLLIVGLAPVCTWGAIELADYLLVTVLEIGLQKRYSKQDLRISLLVNLKMMD